LVVLLHGYGADGRDLIALGQAWQPVLPGAAFVAPDAPMPIALGKTGRQWFALTMRDPTEYWRGVEMAKPALFSFLDAELERLSLPAYRLALVGFSQGAMMALHVGLRLSPPPAAIVGYSGRLAGPQHLPESTPDAPRLMLVHGEEDEVIPVEALELSREALASRGFGLEWHRRPHLGHGIDDAGLRLGASFLHEALPQR
jgi:phospholipase/carboxylesterase